MWALPSKGTAADAIKQVQAAAEKESGHNLQVLHTDNRGEFIAMEFTTYCSDKGIQRHFSAP
jgi:transposase InsO family protein